MVVYLIMKLDLGQIMCFLAVADELSFSRAATQVSLTQQAVSKNIGLLEFRLGVKLFDRERRKSVQLTEFGKLLLPHARAIYAEIGQIEFNLERALGSHSGLIRVGASPTILSLILPKALDTLYAQREGVRTTVERGSYDQLEVALLEGKLDMAFSTEPPESPDPTLQMTVIGQDRYTFVARPRHPIFESTKGKKGFATVGDLKKYPWLSLSNFATADAELKEVFAQMGSRPPLASMFSGSVVFALNWIADTDFISSVPYQIVARHVKRRSLKIIPIDTETPPWNLIVITRRNSKLTPAAQDLIELVKSVVGRHELS